MGNLNNGALERDGSRRVALVTGGSRGIVIIFYADARQLFGFGFVRRNDVHQRQQLV